MYPAHRLLIIDPATSTPTEKPTKKRRPKPSEALPSDAPPASEEKKTEDDGDAS